MKLAAVLVVFEKELATSRSWSTLRQGLAAGGWPSDECLILVYDNSARPHARATAEAAGSVYWHDARNSGTAAAYQWAEGMAAGHGAEWLLLLDDDTTLPPEYFVSLREALTNASTAVGAVVPHVVHRSQLISPAVVTAAGSIRPRRRPEPAPGGFVSAIASGATLRREALRASLPLPSDLWLDFVDHWIFAGLHDHGFQVATLPVTIAHDLSLCDLHSLSRRRLESVLAGEARLAARLGWRARLARPWRLSCRILRYLRVRPVLAAWLARWALGRIASSLSH